MKIAKPQVSDYPPLEEWLDKRGSLVWEHRGKGYAPDVLCYRVNSGIALVLLHKALHGVKAGWSILTELNENDIEKTLADADARTKPPEVTP